MSGTDVHQYEMIYILRPDIEDGTTQELQERLQQAITNQQGETVSIDRWGKRNLAYQIRRYGQGIYILHRFQMNPKGASEIERYMRLNENVIRYLIIRGDD
jgi:small subunit ribosomal protein S6